MLCTTTTATANKYLWLEKTALEQDEGLPLELVDEFPQTHAQILVTARVLHDASSLFICEALLESPQDLSIGELALGKPSLGYDAEPFSQHAKELRAIRNHHDGFLDS